MFGSQGDTPPNSQTTFKTIKPEDIYTARKNKLRSWTPIIIKGEKEKIIKRKIFSIKCYLLEHKELEKLLLDIGFSKVKKNVKIKGENNYDVFLAYK